MDTTYTHGNWVAKPGKEDEFIAIWTELATWTKASFEGAISVVLLRDENDPRKFVSVGPWRSREDVAAWRASEGFRTRVERLQSVLEQFEPGVYRAIWNSDR